MTARVRVQREEDRDVRDMVIEQGALLREIARRLLIIEVEVKIVKPCAVNTDRINTHSKIIGGLIIFSGSLLIAIVSNIDKIIKVLT